VLIVQDRLIKYMVLLPCSKEISSEGVAELLFRGVFSKHGSPHYIVSDRDPRFGSALFTALMESYGVKLLKTTAYRPQGNGQAERGVRTAKDALRKITCRDAHDWWRDLPHVEYAYNSTVNATTLQTPFFLIFGRQAPSPLRAAFPRLRAPMVLSESDAARLARMKKRAEEAGKAVQNKRDTAIVRELLRRNPSITFAVGEQVLLETAPLGEGGLRRSGP